MRRERAVMSAAGALVLAAGALVVAGPLSPSAGPVAASYKTLTEVEPRIAINPTNTPGDAVSAYRITNPGSYYLTGNLAGQAGKDAVIFIAADRVTIDLNGYTILASPGGLGSVAQFAINAGAVTGTTIRNGTMAYAGTNLVSMSNSIGTRVENVTCIAASESGISVGPAAVVTDCVVTSPGTNGIDAGAGSVISRCTVRSAGDTGITASRATVSDCTVVGSGGYGFSLGTASTATNCTAAQCGTGFGAAWGARYIACGAENCTSDGFATGLNATVESCTATLNGDDGFELTDAAIIRNSTTYNNVGHGINAQSRCTVLNNNCSGNGSTVAGITSAGINVAGTDCRVEGNNALNNDWGIRVNGTGNVVVRNTASGSGSFNYTSGAGNVWGPVVAGTYSAGFTGNVASTSTGSTDPNTNYTY